MLRRKLNEAHYEKWVAAYNEYLYHMYDNILSKYKHPSRNIEFDEFCKFMYDHSSGYITQYA